VVLQSLEAHGVRVASVTVSRPSLDDVYLRYAGRTFSEGERAADTANEPDGKSTGRGGKRKAKEGSKTEENEKEAVRA
jgi:ABC-2 type transport system ATP-binding protein